MLHAILTSIALLSPLAPTVQLGGSEAANAEALQTLCATQIRRELDPAELPLAQSSHVQIDCDGYVFMDAPRLAEFVFADDRLTHVWVLVEAGELEALDAAFTDQYGAATVRTDGFSAYFDARAAVRRDVPEALFYAPDAAPLFEAWFSSAG